MAPAMLVPAHVPTTKTAFQPILGVSQLKRGPNRFCCSTRKMQLNLPTLSQRRLSCPKLRIQARSGGTTQATLKPIRWPLPPHLAPYPQLSSRRLPRLLAAAMPSSEANNLPLDAFQKPLTSRMQLCWTVDAKCLKSLRLAQTSGRRLSECHKTAFVTKSTRPSCSVSR